MPGLQFSLLPNVSRWSELIKRTYSVWDQARCFVPYQKTVYLNVITILVCNRNILISLVLYICCVHSGDGAWAASSVKTQSFYLSKVLLHFWVTSCILSKIFGTLWYLLPEDCQILKMHALLSSHVWNLWLTMNLQKRKIWGFYICLSIFQFLK